MDRWTNIKQLTRDVLLSIKPDYTEKDYPDLKGKVYIVTGASSGIGFESAKLLASKGATVYITGRTPQKIRAALEELGGRGKLLSLHHDDLSSIKPAVAEFLAAESRLDGIVHNAGINFRGRNIVPGTDLIDIIVINVVAAFLLQKLLDPIMEKTKGSRIVWVTSAIHYYSPECGGIDWDAMNDYDAGGFLGKGNGMYGQTKAMNIYEAIGWARHHPESQVVSVAVHPGTVYSDIRRSSPWRKRVMESFSRPTIYGAYAELWPLLHPSVTTEDSGSYYIPFGVHGVVRSDVLDAARGPRGEKFWRWISALIEPFE